MKCKNCKLVNNRYPANRPMEEYNMHSINVQTGERTLIDESRTDINPVIIKEEMLEQSERLFKAIEEIIKEQENEN